MDLAEGHVAALKYLAMVQGTAIFNLGTGFGYSVLDVIKAFEEATGASVPYQFGPRREGDVAEVFADSSKAEHELHWKTKRSLKDMCVDLWRWQSSNPYGFK